MSVPGAPPGEAMILLSAEHDAGENRIRLRLYDGAKHALRDVYAPDRDSLYCYARKAPPPAPGAAVRAVERTDLVTGGAVTVHRVSFGDRASLSAFRQSHPSLEADIRPQENYLYDRSLVPGCHYRLADGGKLERAEMERSGELRRDLQQILDGGGRLAEHIRSWSDMLGEPVPDVDMCAVDIEISGDHEGRAVNVDGAPAAVTAIGMAGTRDDLVYVLAGEGDRGRIPETVAGGSARVVEYGNEPDMILSALEVLARYPIVLSWYGDGFDLPYLYNRLARSGVTPKRLSRFGDSATLPGSIHLDLYRFLSNRSIQNYAFSGRYTEYSLDSVCRALLGRGKTGSGADAGGMDPAELAEYCYRDTKLTYDLMMFSKSLVWDLLVLLCRVSKLPVDTVCRTGVAAWIRSMLYSEHRRIGAVIPSADELAARATDVGQEPVSKNKKYRGGMVMAAESGVFWGVSVLDFASLYPTIIAARNLSYETVRCVHEECRDNLLEGTAHWSCRKRDGMLSLLLGSLREVRVRHFKPLSQRADLPPTERDRYGSVAQTLKIVLNAGSGVAGFEAFPLFFLPVAESITSIGRHIIVDVAGECRRRGSAVLYGDTDSIFLHSVDDGLISGACAYAAERHGMDLEMEKRYRYVALSGRKKNYFGVLPNGRVEIRGLGGKKSNTPTWAKNIFSAVLGQLSGVETEDGFAGCRADISAAVRSGVEAVRDRSVPLEDLAFSAKITKAAGEYATIPQHVRAAQELERSFQCRVGQGDTVLFTKTRGGARPLETSRMSEVDPKKYYACLESVMAPVLEPLDMNTGSVMGLGRQAGLAAYLEGGGAP